MAYAVPSGSRTIMRSIHSQNVVLVVRFIPSQPRIVDNHFSPGFRESGTFFLVERRNL
jgi:hypothetical protein